MIIIHHDHISRSFKIIIYYQENIDQDHMAVKENFDKLYLNNKFDILSSLYSSKYFAISFATHKIPWLAHVHPTWNRACSCCFPQMAQEGYR